MINDQKYDFLSKLRKWYGSYRTGNARRYRKGAPCLPGVILIIPVSKLRFKGTAR